MFKSRFFLTAVVLIAIVIDLHNAFAQSNQFKSFGSLTFNAPMSGWFAPGRLEYNGKEVKLRETRNKSEVSIFSFSGMNNDAVKASIRRANKYFAAGLVLDIPAIACIVGALVPLGLGAFAPENANADFQITMLKYGLILGGAGLALHLPAMPLYKKGNSIIEKEIVQYYYSRWSQSSTDGNFTGLAIKLGFHRSLWDGRITPSIGLSASF